MTFMNVSKYTRITFLVCGVLAGCVEQQTFPLTDPSNLTPINEVVTATTYLGRESVMVEFTPEMQKLANDVASGAIPAPDLEPKTLVILPVEFQNGTIEVDLAGELNGKGVPDDRAFIGLAFRIGADAEKSETIYLRMTNGRLAVPLPPPPRDERAIQYVSYPDWPFYRLREMFPGVYEKGANVAPKTWTHLRIEVVGQTASAYLNAEAQPALTVNELKLPAVARGAIGLFCGQGTAAYFSNLRVTKK